MKISIILLLLAAVCNNSPAQKAEQKSSSYILIGTYTGTGKDDGIFVYSFNSNTGDFELKSKISGEENPSFLTFNRKGTMVYAVNEVKDGKVSSFKFDQTKGELSFVNRVTSGGAGPCFVEVDNADKFVFVGNFAGGTLSAIPLNTDGSLKTDIQTIKHEGSSIDKNRQASPHVHSTFLSPDKRYLLVPDLGTDKINIYSYDSKKTTSPLTPAVPAFVSVKPGSGPRHLAIHPDSKHVYLVQEMTGSVTAFDYKEGKLTEIQIISMLAPGFNGRSGAADIHISADGKFLYASNRGDANDIAIYSVNKAGILTHVGNQSVLGKGPRNFTIDPSGNFLLVANQGTNEIVIFKRDKKSGMLTFTNKKIAVNRPVCLKFAPLK